MDCPGISVTNLGVSDKAHDLRYNVRRGPSRGPLDAKIALLFLFFELKNDEVPELSLPRASREERGTVALVSLAVARLVRTLLAMRRLS